MRFILYTNCVSAHQLPLAREIAARVGTDKFRYVSEGENCIENQCVKSTESWITSSKEDLASCETLLVGGLRPIDLVERRVIAGRLTYYMSERWFKPPIGMLRLLHPRYFLMAWRIVRLIRNADSFTYLPIGIHAARDMARLCGLFAGDLRCLFRAPKLDFESKPGGKIWLKNGGDDKRYCLDKMRMWGYFVEPSQLTHSPTLNSTTPNSSTLKVLWVGRFLKLKRVDTIIRAVGELSKSHSSTPPLPHSPTHPLTLDLYGTGPEEAHLKKLAAKYGDNIKFYPPVPIAEVRRLMREHDVYVLSSNAYEGWGAVVSEALEEGMKIIGTYEAGSSATILPESNLFHAGDWKHLLKLLETCVPKIGIGDWSARKASEVVDA